MRDVVQAETAGAPARTSPLRVLWVVLPLALLAAAAVWLFTADPLRNFGADAPPVEIRLAEAKTYRGMLLDIDGTAAPGARVVAGWQHYDLREVVDGRPRQTAESTTGEDGRFEFTRLSVAEPGFSGTVGKGVMRMAPVSVCHQVSMIGLSPPAAR